MKKRARRWPSSMSKKSRKKELRYGWFDRVASTFPKGEIGAPARGVARTSRPSHFAHGLGRITGGHGQVQTGTAVVFTQAWEAAPHKPVVVAEAIHNLLHADGGDIVQRLFPTVRQIPGLPAMFWVSLGRQILALQARPGMGGPVLEQKPWPWPRRTGLARAWRMYSCNSLKRPIVQRLRSWPHAMKPACGPSTRTAVPSSSWRPTMLCTVGMTLPGPCACCARRSESPGRPTRRGLPLWRSRLSDMLHSPAHIVLRSAGSGRGTGQAARETQRVGRGAGELKSLKRRIRVNSAVVSKPMRDPYSVLGLARQASEEDIKRAYFQLVRQFPPEREPEKFREIRTAYEQLRDPENRARLTLFLLQPPPPLPRQRRPSYDLSVHVEDLLHARHGTGAHAHAGRLWRDK